MPPNSLGDPKVGPKNNKQRRELGHAPWLATFQG
jgi:hypothetical protein